MNTPVALLVFNRPQTTERVFAAVAAARPPVLLVVADGPRPNRATDPERCAAVRAIIDRVDWPCQVIKNYADTNMGVQRRGASGFRWVFEQVEEAIILEDDIVPDPSFFPFCEALLKHYRHDERIGHINGFTTLPLAASHPYSYFFSTALFVWGWASWRRAFQHYDERMTRWPALRDRWRKEHHYNRDISYGNGRIFDEVYRGEIACWDYQWIFACWRQSFLSVSPYASLTQNIGFGGEATGTILRNRLAEITSHPVTFPLVHPPDVQRDPWAEEEIRKSLRAALPVRVLSHLPARARTFLRESARHFVSS